MPPPTTDPIVLWHGARAWAGSPAIRPARKGRSEHGPGLYLTTQRATAQKYAKGGGVVLRVLLDPRLAWLEDATLELADAVAFVRSLPRLGPRAKIVADLEANAARMALRLGGARIAAHVIVNLFVNYDATAGANGPALAAFLAARGIDAALVDANSREDWVVVFNPAKIISVAPSPARGFAGPHELPLLRARR